jgi:heat shock protein HslJ
MTLFRPATRCVLLVRGAFTILLLLLTSVAGFAAGEFPYDQELMLDAARMGRAKRVPMLTVSPNGDATIQLWCKDVPARVQVSDGAVTIEPGLLPDALPAMMSDGQCSPERMQADADMLATLAQVTAWQSKGDTLLLSGPMELRFFRSTH